MTIWITKKMTPLNRYREWLKGLVEKPGPFYDILFDLAWEIDFEYDVPNDINRASDGIDLRNRFELDESLKLPDLGNCRMVEFLIGVAIRCDVALYDNLYPNLVSEWFWILLANLSLDRCTDEYLYEYGSDEVVTVFRQLNNREYNSDGSGGGLFPLKNPHQDQRRIEVWYQMMGFLSEKV